jgi:hypothetical protein
MEYLVYLNNQEILQQQEISMQLQIESKKILNAQHAEQAQSIHERYSIENSQTNTDGLQRTNSSSLLRSSSLARSYTWRELAKSLREENVGFTPFLAEADNTTMNANALNQINLSTKNQRTISIHQPEEKKSNTHK